MNFGWGLLIMAVLAVIFIMHLRRTSTGIFIDPRPRMARCGSVVNGKVCGRAIRNCEHLLHGPAWEHHDDGTAMHSDGSRIEHI
jgi:hypothetical protein